PVISARMKLRMTAIFFKTTRICSVSPAVNMFARYSIGILILSIAGKISFTSELLPLPSIVFIIGLSGGIYQTIGMVRYSGCNGKAIFQSIIILYSGEA